MRRDIKIGLIGVFSLIFLSLATLYFYYVWRTYPIHAEFNNASGLSRLDDVSLAGMRVGSVWDIYLTRDGKAHAVLLVYNRYKEYIPVDSTAKIKPPGTSSAKYAVDITPGVSSAALPGDGYVRTQKTVELQDLIARAEVLTGTMQRSFAAVDRLLGDPQMVTALRRSAINLEIASRKSVVLLDCLQGVVSDNRARIPQILASVDTTAANFEALSRDLRRLSDQSAPVLKQTTVDVGVAAHDLRAMSARLRAVVDSADPADIQATLKSARAASENIEVVSERLRALTEDPALAAQAKTMLEDLRKALAGAAQVVEQVQKLLSAP